MHFSIKIIILRKHDWKILNNSICVCHVLTINSLKTKINHMVLTTFTLEQKPVFKLERNNNLTFIVIIIDIEKKK